MDIDDMRVLVTVLSFVTFIGIVWWAYSGHRRRRFEEAARLPFADHRAGEARSNAENRGAQ